MSKKAFALGDCHVPFEKLQHYAQHDVESVETLRKIFHGMIVTSDLCHLLNLLGIKSAPKKYRTVVFDSISDEEHELVLTGDKHE